MSDLSERLHAHLTPEDAEQAMQKLHQMHETPGFHEYSRYSHKLMQVMLKEGKFFFNGVTWQDGNDAMHRTTNYMQNRVLSKLIELFAIGLLVGGNQEYQKCRDFKSLFESEAFQYQATFRALEIVTDNDTKNEITNFLAAMLAGMTRAIGFLEAPPDELSHVWDLWYHSIGNTCQALYLAGYQIGDQMREEEILRGIELATRSEAGE